MSNFNFQWIKHCSRIILFKQYPWPFFKIFKDYRRNYLSVITPKKICCESPRNIMSNFTTWHLAYEIFIILPVLSQFLRPLKIKITQFPNGFCLNHFNIILPPKYSPTLVLNTLLHHFESCWGNICTSWKN